MASELSNDLQSGAGITETSTAAPSSIGYEDVSLGVKPDSETSRTGLTGGGGGDEEQLVSTMQTLTIEEPSTFHGDAIPEDISLTATNAELAQVLPPTYEGPPAPTQNLTTQQSTPGTHLSPAAMQAPMSSVRNYQSIFSGPVAPAQSPQMLPPNYSDLPPPTNPYYTSAGGQGAQIPPGVPGAQYQPYYVQGAPTQVYQPPHPTGVYVSQFSTASSSSWASVELPAPSYHMTQQVAVAPSQSEYGGLYTGMYMYIHV